MTDNEVAAPSGAVDRLAGLVDAAEGDRRARRRLLDRASRVLAADADAERRARSAVADAERRVRSVEADADARIRAAEARIRVQEREREASRAERDAGRAEQAATREARSEITAVRRARWSERREMAGAAAPATLSMLVYLAAVASAVFGQISVATGRYHWSMIRALVLAGFIELMALAMAMTANRLRLRGERALAPRVLTWVFASFAASVNIWGHFNDPLMAAGLGAASLGGITLWEIRLSARHRDALRRVGQLAEPLPSFGLRFWLFQPPVAMAAYRVGVRTRVSLAAAPLVAQAEAERAVRLAARGSRRPRTGLLLASAFAAGIAAAFLTTMTAPPAVSARPVWWLAGAGVVMVVFAVGAAVSRRGAHRPGDGGGMGNTGKSQLVPEPVPTAQRGTPSHPVPGHSPAVHSPAAHPPAAHTPTGSQLNGNGHGGARLAGQPAPAVPAVLSSTGEFRALTSPEHYWLDAIGGEDQHPSPLASKPATATDIPAAPVATPAPTPTPTTVSKATSQTPRRAAAKRSGLPEEARQWIAECLLADQAPTGPDVGRRFRVDASTGRRWVRQVREALPVDPIG